ncbi:MAG: TonB-dependent receptor [Acidobacteriota bacterium]
MRPPSLSMSILVTAHLIVAVPMGAQLGNSEPPDGSRLADTEEQEIESSDRPEEVEVFEEIVVTGGLIEDSLQETPESVAVWRSDNLTDAGMGELQDIFNQTANAYQISNGEGFGIRGINHNSVGTGGAGELGSYYVDGVALTGFAKRFGPMQLWDVDQVEILRGPQTTNVGRNALAGAVLLQTKNPVFQNESRWRLGLADETTWDLAGMVNVAVDDHSAFRFTAESWNTDGFITNPTRDEDDFDARENLTVRGKYLYQPGSASGFSLVVSAQYGETLRGNDTVDLMRADERLNFSNLDDFEENESIVLSADASWRLNERWSMRSITSFLDADYDRFDDDDQGPANGNASRGRTSTDSNWAQDLRLEYAAGRVRGATGVYYTEVDSDGETFADVGLSPLDLGIPSGLLPFYPEAIFISLDSPFAIETTNFAAFTHWDWDLGDRWSVFGGVRWDLEEQTSNQTTGTTLESELPDTSLLPPPIAGAIDAVNAVLLSQLGTTTAVTDTDYDAFLPEFGFSYAWSDAVNASLFYKRGYRAGGAEVSLTGRLNEYDPETLDLVEFSLRSVGGADDRATLNANLYFGSWTDQQVNVQQSANAFDFLTENAGEAEIYGFEVDFAYRPLASWEVYGSLGYAQTEFTEFESATQGDLSGNRFGIAPEWTAAIGANYRFGDGWFVHGDIGFQDDAFASVENDPELVIEERTLLNLRGGFETARYSILGYIENVSDETYAVTAFRNIDGRILGKVGAPRQAGVQLVLRF